jgi:menaquinone-dependent protoporphyrinogen oxidase
MEKKVLVAYASKYGATAEIASRVGSVLQAAGLPVDVKRAGEVTDLASYDAVILGSAVYAGQWRQEAADFLKENEQVLKSVPVWLFSSGPTGEGDPVALMQGWRFPEALQPIADRIGTRDVAFFAGAIDMNRLNLAEKLIVKAVKAPDGDFRDWAVIEAWASGIAGALQMTAV